MNQHIEPLDIGCRVEIMIDDRLFDQKKHVKWILHQPTRKETSLYMDKPWEGPGSGVYSTVFQKGSEYRMYYRASMPGHQNDRSERQGCAVAISKDGIVWQRPNLGLISYEDEDTNMIVTGSLAHNFSPFYDTNPSAGDHESYKAIAGLAPDGLFGYVSSDGLHFKTVGQKALIKNGAFDSHNVAFYDTIQKKYRCYSRYFTKDEPRIRAIQSCESVDFEKWTDPFPNAYDPSVPFEHFYTNATVPCPKAEHIFLAFPMRFVPERHKNRTHQKPGISDNVIMSSRDGCHWDRMFCQSYIEPGLDERNWTQRSMIIAQGIVQTGEEFSLYVNENYMWDTCRITRFSMPMLRFASVYGAYDGGFVATKPMVLKGRKIALNYKTSAPGTIKTALYDSFGQPIRGFTFDDADPLFGDELKRTITWNGSSDISVLMGQVVRIGFSLYDANLYALEIMDK